MLLGGEDALLTGDDARPVVRPNGTDERGPGQVRLTRSSGGQWALLCAGARVAVNGVPLELGLRVLRERDEIRIGRSYLFFSEEEQAGVVSFPRDRERLRCARCRQWIEPEDMAVACPGCGLWHHQGDKYACWIYEPTCAGCDQPTSLDAGLRWTPEDL